jgi:hypothetical protein
MVGARDDVGDDLGFLRIWNRGFEDADDRRGPITQADDLTEHRRVALERGGPEAIRQNRGAVGLWPVVSGAEQAAQHRLEPHDLEVRAANDAGADSSRLAEAEHRELYG